MRNIHASFQAKMPYEAHGYCVALLTIHAISVTVCRATAARVAGFLKLIAVVEALSCIYNFKQ
jgi:hypothetical protein